MKKRGWVKRTSAVLLVLVLGIAPSVAYGVENDADIMLISENAEPGVIPISDSIDTGERDDGTAAGLTVAFDLNGGQGRAPEKLAAADKAVITLPVCGARVFGSDQKSYRAFIGWKVKDRDDAELLSAGAEYTVTESVTFSAVYDDEVTRTYVPAWVTVELNQDQNHKKYMSGANDGLFWPGRHLTRAELAQILANLLTPSSADASVTLPFDDVASDAWYYNAVRTLYARALMQGRTAAHFAPDELVTRSEMAGILEAWIMPADNAPWFPDVSSTHPKYSAISAAASRGLFSGSNTGAFNPEAYLTRAETVTVINRLLGRVPDTGAIGVRTDLRYYPDVPTNHWAYTQVMEAAVSHTASGGSGTEYWSGAEAEKVDLPDGYHRMNGGLYLIQNGAFVRNATVGDMAFDSEGRYTTGDEELDQMLNDIVNSQTNEGMDRDAKLRALYLYVRDNFTYLPRPHVQKDQTGWENEYTKEFLQKKKGNCYSFAAAYYLLVRELGHSNAQLIVGTVGHRGTPHGWVEIVLDGTNYIFDTELEYAYRYQKKITKYNFFKMPYNKIPWPYTK